MQSMMLGRNTLSADRKYCKESWFTEHKHNPITLIDPVTLRVKGDTIQHLAAYVQCHLIGHKWN